MCAAPWNFFRLFRPATSDGFVRPFFALVANRERAEDLEAQVKERDVLVEELVLSNQAQLERNETLTVQNEDLRGEFNEAVRFLSFFSIEHESKGGTAENKWCVRVVAVRFSLLLVPVLSLLHGRMHPGTRASVDVGCPRLSYALYIRGRGFCSRCSCYVCCPVR